MTNPASTTEDTPRFTISSSSELSEAALTALATLLLELAEADETTRPNPPPAGPPEQELNRWI